MLRLTARDADDLNVISAQMQDAVLRFADLDFNAKKRRFTLVANRFAWDDAQAKTRRRTGLHFDFVKSVQKQGFKTTVQMINPVDIGFTLCGQTSNHQGH